MNKNSTTADAAEDLSGKKPVCAYLAISDVAAIGRALGGTVLREGRPRNLKTNTHKQHSGELRVPVTTKETRRRDLPQTCLKRNDASGTSETQRLIRRLRIEGRRVVYLLDSGDGRVAGAGAGGGGGDSGDAPLQSFADAPGGGGRGLGSL